VGKGEPSPEHSSYCDWRLVFKLSVLHWKGYLLKNLFIKLCKNKGLLREGGGGREEEIRTHFLYHVRI
jgi:hypothetical protein